MNKLLIQVQKEIKEKEKEKEERIQKIQIKQMLGTISSKKEQVDKLNTEIKGLEDRLEKEDYLSLNTFDYGNFTVDYGNFTARMSEYTINPQDSTLTHLL